MRFWFSAACVALFLFASTGCLELTQKVTLNPDGSGKAALDMKIMPMPAMIPGADQQIDFQALAKKALSDIVLKSRDVDAWKDVTYNVEGDGRIHITGTAYFKNIDKLGVGGAGGRALKVKWARDPDGGMTLALILPTPPAGRGNGQPPTDDEVDQRLTMMRGRWDAMRTMVGTAADAFKIDATYLLPGTVDKESIVQPVQGGVRLTVDGKKLFNSIDRMMDNDNELKAGIKSGKGVMGLGIDRDKIMKLAFGQSGDISAHVTGEMKTQFDYEGEVAAAKEAQPEMIKKLGLIPKEPAGDAPAPAPTNKPAEQ